MTAGNVSEVCILPASSMNLTMTTLGIVLESKTVPAPALGLVQGSGWGGIKLLFIRVIILAFSKKRALFPPMTL